MARNASVRSVRGCGDWIGKTSVWDDPRAQLDSSSPVLDVPTATAMVTEKQLAFLKSLFEAQKGNEIADVLRGGLLALYKEGKLTSKVASGGIKVLLANR